MKANEDNDIYNIKYKYPLTEKNQKKPKNTSETINCFLLGNSKVGKSSFIRCLLEKDITQMISTLGIDVQRFISQVNEKKVFIEIYDTGGLERSSKTLLQFYYKNADCILLFYDVTNKESFDNINYWIKEIKEENEKEGKYTLFLIGNKIDNNENRVVEKKVAKKLAETNNIKYFECSCLNKINIFEILNEIALLANKKELKNNEDNEDNEKEVLFLKKIKENNIRKKCC